MSASWVARQPVQCSGRENGGGGGSRGVGEYGEGGGI